MNQKKLRVVIYSRRVDGGAGRYYSLPTTGISPESDFNDVINGFSFSIQSK